MASIYRRGRYFWIQFIDATGKRRQESTKLRWQVTSEARKAHDLCRQFAQEESVRDTTGETWGCWVLPFLEQRYANRYPTLMRNKRSWRNLAAFLESHAIAIPRQLSRSHVRTYISWRAIAHPELGVFAVCKNTALHEIKLLGLLMREAVQSGFAGVNPCERLGIPNDPSRRKPRITESEHSDILAALELEADWMRISYIIAWEQGCRFGETCLPLSEVDLERRVIRFRTKGHKDSLTEFPLSAALVPMFERMKAEGRIETFVMPTSPGKKWWDFFRRVGLSHLCFHSTRVTFVTRCYEAGIPRDAVMRLAGHTSFAAHAVYPRVTADHASAQALRQLL